MPRKHDLCADGAHDVAHASMRPRRGCRGILDAAVQRIPLGTCFNEAAARLPRKTPHRQPASGHPRTRFNEAAAWPPRNTSC